MPKRCHSAHDKNEQRTREIEDKIIHIARARSGVHLQHLHRRDAQRERRREEENASLPAEQCGQKYTHRRKRDQVACQIEHHKPQRDIAVAVGQQIIFHRTERLQIHHIERGMTKSAAERVIEKQHIQQHPYVVQKQRQHVQPPPYRTRIVRHAAEQRSTQKYRKNRCKHEFLLGCNGDSGC